MNVRRGIFGVVVVDGGAVVWRFVGLTAECDVVFARRQGWLASLRYGILSIQC